MADPSGSHLRAVILAGGAGRRLGGVDKALLILHGRTMLDHAIATVSGQVGAVALSAAGDASRFARFGIPVLEDGRHRGKGPLAGVLAGMRWAAAAGGETLLSLPVDTPFAPRDLVARLGAAPSVAASHGRTHHLVALWPVAAADALERFLDGKGLYDALMQQEREALLESSVAKLIDSKAVRVQPRCVACRKKEVCRKCNGGTSP